MTDNSRSELFLSCDLVGSTSFKQQEDGWREAFLGFYREFPQLVGDLSSNAELDFVLWKAIGDQLIFTVTVCREDQVYRAIRLWLNAMADFEKDSLDKRMGLHGGAFIATFPVPDSEATVPRDPQTEKSDLSPVELNRVALQDERDYSKYMYDYFGPSIDTGFRVLDASTVRYFTVSVEVAWALLLAERDQSDRHLEDLRFLGERTMHGVWGGRSYPLFALDRQYSDDVNQALVKINGSALSLPDAKDLCQKCVASDHWMSALYLPESGVDAVKHRPVDPLPKQSEVNQGKGIETVPGDDPDGSESLIPAPPLGDG